ncbi:MAG: type II secretion system F family protein [Acidobacteria bacterium]|nr:type II secretion system F family protein [Acidobacteriota bacterium]
MTMEFWYLGGLFLFVLGAVLIAGYVFVLLPATAGANQTGESTQEVVAWALKRLGESVPSPRRDGGALRLRLAAAGYRWPSAATMFQGARTAGAILLAAGAGWTVAVLRGSLSEAIAPALCAGGFGYMLASRVVEALIRARGRRLRCGLPAALDLLILGLEAGQPLDYALAETGRVLRHAHPDLSAELAFVQIEMQLGSSRTQALRNMAERNSEPELRKLSTLIVESDRFGTSPVSALHSQARYLRTRMRQQANETARKLSVKLVFPVFFLILPSLLLVTLGPAVIQMAGELSRLVGSDIP